MNGEKWIQAEGNMWSNVNKRLLLLQLDMKEKETGEKVGTTNTI